ncbi:MAG: hypothetical protein A2275_00880 [Bacteroidetes bacterium RIFOXYA12_FULL_35_11]|nr:MAG: hypothetical protein A2X01_17235 [Bacteroidetes bacterium GWF2_35_48]OFY74043.1 MAG: hypothetical protein A2275_00880 [Bacteroidetes bacterium RIFOXYA12_FULL_35_11]OFY97748.1 MAG: hypothetical protein A2309_10560 [Bacteroidetes bacterium RIFOXYB2_FULL_35_7]OFZ00338.1 MAG: hypothetical protein A2491_14530 [Bacteroidetes bacterium RIFOXYC12_FULL_35_7]HBX53019.1 hypothetical protein [Bacteroidales bacterium]
MLRAILLISVFLFFFPFFSSAEVLFSACQEKTIVIVVENSAEADYFLTYQDNIKAGKKKYFKIGKKIFRNPFYKENTANGKQKFATIVIILLTGPLGGHRLYLGTKPVVPVIYAVTLGGGIGILPIIDLFAIAFTKDISRYVDNERVIMWLK